MMVFTLGLLTGSLLILYISCTQEIRNPTGRPGKPQASSPGPGGMGFAVSSFYLVVLTSLAYFLGYAVLGQGLLTLNYLVFATLLVMISWIDAYTQLIPDELVLSIFMWWFFGQLFYPQLSILSAVGGFLVGGGTLYLVFVFSGGGLGGGDVKLMAAAGLYLGPAETGLALFVAFVAGGLWGVVLLTAKVKKGKEYIALGPFLCMGILVSLLWGEVLINAYLELFLL